MANSVNRNSRFKATRAENDPGYQHLLLLLNRQFLLLYSNRIQSVTSLHVGRDR